MAELSPVCDMSDGERLTVNQCAKHKKKGPTTSLNFKLYLINVGIIYRQLNKIFSINCLTMTTFFLNLLICPDDDRYDGDTVVTLTIKSATKANI